MADVAQSPLTYHAMAYPVRREQGFERQLTAESESDPSQIRMVLRREQGFERQLASLQRHGLITHAMT